jgi:hypothetical protein
VHWRKLKRSTMYSHPIFIDSPHLVFIQELRAKCREYNSHITPHEYSYSTRNEAPISDEEVARFLVSLYLKADD